MLRRVYEVEGETLERLEQVERILDISGERALALCVREGWLSLTVPALATETDAVISTWAAAADELRQPE